MFIVITDELKGADQLAMIPLPCGCVSLYVCCLYTVFLAMLQCIQHLYAGPVCCLLISKAPRRFAKI